MVLLLVGSAIGTSGEVYTGNMSERRAASHLLGTTPRDIEVVTARFHWDGTVMVLRVHLRKVDPYVRSARWQVSQILGLDITVRGRTRMVDTNTTRPGGPEGYSCGVGGSVPFGTGISRSSSTNVYVFRIPRAAFIRCGFHPGRVIDVYADAMISTDNMPAGTTAPVLQGTWAATWTPQYKFRL